MRRTGGGWLLIILGCALWLGGCAKKHQFAYSSLKNADTVAQLKQFVAEKESQAATATNVASPGVAAFFAAAKTGDWTTVSNTFSQLREYRGQLRGPRWEAVVEVWGAFDAFGEGDEKYSAAFGRDIIASIPPGSIYFGGTDPGRFVVTALCRSQVAGDPFFVLTQNPLPDGSYLDYLRQMYGNKIYIPSAEDLQKSFQDYTQDAQRRLAHDQQFPNEPRQLKPGEDVKLDANGRIELRGQMNVIGIRELLTKIIFEKNPNREFYLEESFPLDWMYLRLEPHGLIFKLNRQPMATLSDEVVQTDHDYWAKYVQPIIGDWLKDDTSVTDVTAFAEKTFGQQDFSGFQGDPRFVQNAYAQKAFSKLRSSIAGLYAWRAENAIDDREKARMSRAADFAFRQALALCPASTEVATRYVNFLNQQHREADVRLVQALAERFKPVPASTAASSKAAVFELRLVRDNPAEDTELMHIVSQHGSVVNIEPLEVAKAVLLDQTAVQSARLQKYPPMPSRIQIIFTDAGREQLAEITRQHLHQKLAIIIDGKLWMAPVVSAEITDGTAEIAGSFTEDEANDLIAKINAAAGE